MPTRFGAEVGTLQSFVTATAVKAQEIIQLYNEAQGWPFVDPISGEEFVDQSDQAQLDYFIDKVLNNHVISIARQQRRRNIEEAAREAAQTDIDQTDWSS